MMPIFIRPTEAAKIACHYENLTLGSFRKDVVSRNTFYLKILQACTTRLIDTYAVLTWISYMMQKHGIWMHLAKICSSTAWVFILSSVGWVYVTRLKIKLQMVQLV